MPAKAKIRDPHGALRLPLLVGLGLFLVLIAGIGIRCLRDPAIPFLAGTGGASWIVYPVPQEIVSRKAIEMSCEFRRSFDLPAVPSSAKLRLQAFRRASITLNGKPLAAGPREDNWKRATEIEVAGNLRPGENEIAVLVSNDKGPPALRLSLAAGSLVLETDSAWRASLAGSSWRPARPASLAVGLVLAERPASTLKAVRRVWPLLLGLAAIAGLVLLGWKHAPGMRGRWVLPGLLASAWVVLVLHDLGSLPATYGFDSLGHLSYIEHLRDRQAVPLADQGWQMYQPPLYYAASAAALAVVGASPHDLAGRAALRAVGLAAGIGQVFLILASLRLLFPDRPRSQLAGVVLAAFVPVHLYLFQAVTNEALAATLGTAAVYLGLRILREERPSAAGGALLGLALGAALLAKLSALLPVLAILAALGARLLARRRWEARSWLHGLGLPLAVCLAVCGWHYLGVWSRFGSPLVGNWDEGIGVAWWQDPGYRTASYYLRFGRSLAEPFFSGLHGFLDGLYSTLWGDGLWGGAPGPETRPPWNYDLMSAGYLLALLPAALIAIGAAAGLVSLLRRPRADGLLLAALGALTAVALLFMTLRVASYAQVKAFYGLTAVVPLCASLGLGFDLLARRSKAALALLAVGLGTWGACAYFSFWIRASAPETLARLGIEADYHDRFGEAVRVLERALDLDPTSAAARFALAHTLARQGRQSEALDHYRKLLESDPSNVSASLAVASSLAREGKLDDAIGLARRAAAASPDDPEALTLLGQLLWNRGAGGEAIETLRNAIGNRPNHAKAHHSLGLAYAASGRHEEAILHYRYALLVSPGSREAAQALSQSLAATGRRPEAGAGRP